MYVRVCVCLRVCVYSMPVPVCILCLCLCLCRVSVCVSVRCSLALVRCSTNPQGDQHSHITSRPEAWRCQALPRTLLRRRCGCLLDKRDKRVNIMSISVVVIGVELLPKSFHVLPILWMRRQECLSLPLDWNLPLECREEVLRFLFLCQVRQNHAS